MNNTQTHETLPISKKDRKCRAIKYQHFKTVKKKFTELKKRQGHRAGYPRRWNKC